MQKYGIAVEQLSGPGAAAVQAAERMRARTLIYRDKIPVAAVIPVEELESLESPEPAQPGQDPLLSLCGTCNDDAFVDSLLSDLSQTMLFTQPRSRPLPPPNRAKSRSRIRR